jgi:hypothetical protein
VLVVGDRDGTQIARDFRRNGELAGGDERVIGRLVVPGVIQVEVTACRGAEQQERPK